MSDGRKVYIVYRHVNTWHRSGEFGVSEPSGWAAMTRKERVRWAKAQLERKNSAWVYEQIQGLPY